VSGARAAVPFPELVEGTLIRRYKRFLADVRLSGGDVVTCHNTNTGSMLGCSEPGSKVFLSESQNPARKYRHTWELVEADGGLVGVNTALPNRLAARAFSEGAVPGVPRMSSVKAEARHGASRLDFLLTAPDGKRTYVEVKNCTLVRDSHALFPDAVSVRATRHLHELMDIAYCGDRAIILIIVAHPGAKFFSPADTIDPLWGKTLREALKNGVELMVHEERLSLSEAVFGRKIPHALTGKPLP
jgi:sugar fermentation stimulation protein A